MIPVPMTTRPLRTLPALLLAAALAAAAAACGESSIAPRTTPATPSNETLRVGIVVLEDEIVLSGRLFGPLNEPLVILSHMRPNDQTAWFSFAEELSQEGFAVLTYDFRGYGESDGDQDFAKLDDDLRAVINYMRDQGREQIFLVGASMGGTTSLVLAAEGEVDGVVSISSPSEFEGQDAAGAVPSITAPKLFLAAEGDTAAELSLQEMVDLAPPPVDSQTWPGLAHGTDMLDPARNDESAATRQRIIDFLSQYAD